MRFTSEKTANIIHYAQSTKPIIFENVPIPTSFVSALEQEHHFYPLNGKSIQEDDTFQPFLQALFATQDSLEDVTLALEWSENVFHRIRINEISNPQKISIKESPERTIILDRHADRWGQVAINIKLANIATDDKYGKKYEKELYGISKDWNGIYFDAFRVAIPEE